jgi:hypothetical protein
MSESIDTPVIADTSVENTEVESVKSEPVKDEWAPKKLKVNGKEVTFSSKSEYEAAVEKYLSIGMAAEDKFKSAKQLHEEATKILEVAKTEKSAKKMLEKAGYSADEIRQILEEELTNIYKYEDMSEEEKARLKEKEELEKYRQAEEERKRKEELEQMTRQEQQFYAEVENNLLDALESSKLPRDPLMAKFALQYMAADEARGLEPDPVRAVKLVEREMPLLVGSILNGMDIETRKRFLGKEVLESLRKDALAQVQKSEAPFAKPKNDKAVSQVSAPERKKSEVESKDDGPRSMKEFRKQVRGY